MREVVIVSAVRSAICRADKGSLARLRPDELMAAVIKEALAKTGHVNRHEIGDVLVGCATQEGEQGLNLARNAAIMAEIPVTVPAATISRYCSSSLTALVTGASLIQSGHTDLMVVGGVESMSRVPLGGYNPSPPPRLMESHPEAFTPAGVAAENLAVKFNISREEQDAYATESHRRAIEAWTNGHFANEVISVKCLDEKRQETAVTRDDIPCEIDPEALAKLSPVFLAGGSVTAGNSAPRSDGAAALVLMSASKAADLGLKPLATLRTWARVGCPAEIMSYGAVTAANQVLENAKLDAAQLEHIELSEQFAVSAIAGLRELKLPYAERVNPYGGAIALGHPIGAAGARMACTLVNGLFHRGGGYGLLTIGVLGGQGEALIVESRP